MHHEGNLVITAENAHLAATLVSVGGDLYSEAEGVTFPALTSVGGYLSSRAEGVAFPALTSVGGYPLPDEGTAAARLAIVAKAALAADDALEMKLWHTCDTTHCIAGWAAHLFPEGRNIEADKSTSVAGSAMLGLEATLHFHVSNDKARAFLQRYL